MYCTKLNVILLFFALFVIAVAAPGNSAYAANQSQINAALQKSADMRQKVENMMRRGKKYDDDIKQMVAQRHETLKIIYDANAQTKQLAAQHEILSSDLQKINFDKTLTFQQWQEISGHVRKKIEVITEKQAKILKKVEEKNAELEILESDLEDTIRYAKKLDKARKVAFDQWEQAEEEAKALLNNTETAAGGR